MKPWGSQVRNYMISNTEANIVSPATEKMASGGPGGGKEPPGRGTDAAKHQHGRRPPDTDTPWGCSRLFGFRPGAAGRPSHPNPPRRPLDFFRNKEYVSF